MGFGLGGNIPLDTTITLEFLPTKNRYLLATLSLFQPLGVTLCTIIALGIVSVPIVCTITIEADSCVGTGLNIAAIWTFQLAAPDKCLAAPSPPTWDGDTS